MDKYAYKIPSDKIFCQGSGYWGRDLIQSKYKGPDGGQIKITKPGSAGGAEVIKQYCKRGCIMQSLSSFMNTIRFNFSVYR